MTRQTKAELIERLEAVLRHHEHMIEFYEKDLEDFASADIHAEQWNKANALWYRIMDADTID